MIPQARVQGRVINGVPYVLINAGQTFKMRRGIVPKDSGHGGLPNKRGKSGVEPHQPSALSGS